MANVLITGANRGIGLEFCKQFQARGESVIAVCRTPSSDLQELGVRVITGIDVSSPEDIQTLARELEGTSIHLLINNAGILRNETIQDMDFEQIRTQFEINSMGPLRVCVALLSNLAKGSKIALITSRMGSIEDNTSGSRYGYRMSKAALNIAGVSLARDLKEREISVAILHPGFVRTGMTGNQGNIDTKGSVDGLIERIEQLTLENSGTFWHANGEILPW